MSKTVIWIYCIVGVLLIVLSFFSGAYVEYNSTFYHKIWIDWNLLFQAMQGLGTIAIPCVLFYFQEKQKEKQSRKEFLKLLLEENNSLYEEFIAREWKLTDLWSNLCHIPTEVDNFEATRLLEDLYPHLKVRIFINQASHLFTTEYAHYDTYLKVLNYVNDTYQNLRDVSLDSLGDQLYLEENNKPVLTALALLIFHYTGVLSSCLSLLLSMCKYPYAQTSESISRNIGTIEHQIEGCQRDLEDYEKFKQERNLKLGRKNIMSSHPRREIK